MTPTPSAPPPGSIRVSQEETAVRHRQVQSAQAPPRWLSASPAHAIARQAQRSEPVAAPNGVAAVRTPARFQRASTALRKEDFLRKSGCAACSGVRPRSDPDPWALMPSRACPCDNIGPLCRPSPTAAQRRIDYQVVRRRTSLTGRVVRPACRRGARARRRERRRQEHPDQGHHRRGRAGRGDARAWPGSPCPRMTPAISRALGIAAIYQQPSLFPHLTVAENIALALERGHAWRRVDWRARARPRGGSAGARRRVDRARPAGRDAQHARAADGRDRQGARRRREAS